MLALIWNNGPWEWIIILVVVLIFFGAGKLPQVMSQMGKGVKAFKDGIKDGGKEAQDVLETSALETDENLETELIEAEEVQKVE